jgi:hypothetical protein
MLQKNNAEGFIKAVAAAMERPDRVLMTSLIGFYEEPELLYTALLYASVHHVTVMVMPEDMNKAEPSNRSYQP